MTDEVATYRDAHKPVATFSANVSIRRNRHFTNDICVIVIPYTSIKGEEATLGKYVIWITYESSLAVI